MAKTTVAQFSFNRGELDPVLHGRSDWKYYYSGAEKLQNLITRQQGGAVKRGGLRLVARALDDDRPSRLVPFRFSVKQSYLLEFGHHRLRIIKDGGVVLYPAGHARAGEEVIVDTPYPAEALSELRHAQTADIMILTHAGHAPRRLSRHDHHDWRFDKLIPDDRTHAPAGLAVVRSGGDDARYVVTAYAAATGESAPSDAVLARNDGLVVYDHADKKFSELFNWLYEHDYSYMPDDLDFYNMDAEQLVAFLRACGYADYGAGLYSNGSGGWQWLHKKPDGSVFNTVDWWPGATANLISECLYACDKGWAGNVGSTLQSWIDTYVRDYNAGLVGTHITELSWTGSAGAEKYRVYRESTISGSKQFRLLGETADTNFVDNNFETLSETLPEALDHFSGVDDYPGVCAFFEQRLILARSNNKPTTFWGSDTGAYNSFGRHTPIEDSDSYEFTLASGEMNEIHWVVPLNEMLLGTSGSEWKAGGGGSAITPTNINARVQSWYGCSPMQPLVVGRTVLFAGRSRRSVRNFSYSLEADGYAGNDLTVYANHLFAGRTIVSMCHQRDPDGIVWVVLSDGGLLSCTYSPEEDVVAWSRHATAGRFESCCSVVDPDGGDQIYFCVARDMGGASRRFIEMLTPHADAVGGEADGFFVDCGLTYRGNPAGRIGGLDHLEGELAACLADGCVFENLAVRDGGITLPDGFKAALVHVGLPYRVELGTLELEPEKDETFRNRSRFAVSATIRLYKSRDCLYGQTGGTLSEMKFRVSEPPGQAAKLFSGEKNVALTSPPGGRSVRLTLASGTPTPFTVLGIIAEASHGQPA